MPSFEKFSQLAAETDEKNNENIKTKKAVQRQAISELEQEKTATNSDLKDKQEEERKEEKQNNELFGSRQSIKAEGRATLVAAKQKEKLSLLRDNAQTIFGENIAKLKEINEAVKAGRSRRLALKTELQRLEEKLAEQTERINQLTTEPLREKVKEYEQEFQKLNLGYQELNELIDTKNKKLWSIGLKEIRTLETREAEKAPALMTDSDGFGPGPIYILENKQTPSEKYQTDRLPINKALDDFFSDWDQEKLKEIWDKRDKRGGDYKNLMSDLLQKPAQPEGGAAKDTEGNLQLHLSEKYGVKTEKIKTIRSLVQEYFTLRNEIASLLNKREEKWQEMNGWLDQKREAQKLLIGQERSLAETKGKLDQAEQSLTNYQATLEFNEKEIKKLKGEISDLEQKLSQNPDEWEKTAKKLTAEQTLTDQGLLTILQKNNIAHDLSKILPDKTSFNKPDQESAISATRAYLKKLQTEIDGRNQDTQDLKNKMFVFGRDKKILSIEQEVKQLNNWKNTVSGLMINNYLPIYDAHKKDYQELLNKRGRLSQHENNKNTLKHKIPEQSDLINNLNLILEEAEDKLIETRAMLQADFQKVEA